MELGGIVRVAQDSGDEQGGNSGKASKEEKREAGEEQAAEQLRDILRASREAEKGERQAGQQGQGEQRESQETVRSGEKLELRRDEHGTTETGEWRKQGEQGGTGMETNGAKETVDEDWTEESTVRERKGVWPRMLPSLSAKLL